MEIGVQNDDHGNTKHAAERSPVVPLPEPLLLRAPQAAAVCGTSARTWRTWDASGRVPAPIRLGRSIFWRLDELRAWVAAGCPDRELWQTLRD